MNVLKVIYYTNYQIPCKGYLVYSFNGKEKDYESGFHYYGARYYNSELSMWLSTDPMSDNAPMHSPYAYCFNNPVKLVDPDGKFPWRMHMKMLAKSYVKKAGLGTFSNISTLAKLAWGTGPKADIIHAFKANIHLDNYNNFNDIYSDYTNAVNSAKTNLSERNYIKAGEDIHTVVDFYSHSNYISLYNDYMGDNDFNIDDIPTFEEGVNIPGFREKLENELKTGIYPDRKADNKENSHEYMNLDSNKRNGSTKMGNTGRATKHEAAKKTAQKATDKIINDSNL